MKQFLISVVLSLVCWAHAQSPESINVYSQPGWCTWCPMPTRLPDGLRVDVPANLFHEGGWKLDVQFMDAMGSPYLLAHGMGAPVPDATATVEIPEAGDWHVWVRSRKWVEGAGAFQLLVGGVALERTFGRSGDTWAWEDGGTVTLPAGRTRLQLRDLDGFDGRCAGVVLTKGEDAPQGAISVTDREPEETHDFEFVVVGGGIPGCCAAVAAARAGAKVALVQDRPVLGGNASGEVRVWSGGEVRYPLVSELRGQFRNKGYENAFSDSDRQAKLEREPNLTLFLSHRAFGVEKDGARIAAVKALDLANDRVVRFRAPYFCDTTGDGWVGFWAGADYRYGREGRDETGEKYAPEKGDSQTLGSSIMWESSTATIDSPFSAPWAEPYACGVDRVAGDWNWEFGLRQNLFSDGEAVRDRVLLAIYGAFSNAKKKPKNAFLRLTTCPFILGKRESRRLLGDHVFCEQDITEKRLFDDAVASGSWSIDLHYTIDEKVPFLTRCEQPHYGRYWIPYRSLYSRNVPNLFMAGRCFSCTHVGLGSPRVINTLAQLGCAVGEAAAMCLKGGYSPRELYTKGHARELQRRLGGDFPENPDPEQAGWAFVDDETEGAVTFAGHWRFDWNCNGGQAGDRTHNTTDPAATATYRLPVAASGCYRLMGLVPSLFFANGDCLVELTIKSGGKLQTLVWNQYPQSGWWQELGVVDLEPGAELTLKRAADCKNRIYADGFALAPVAAHEVDLDVQETIRTEILSEGWTFRLEGEKEARPVRVPHDWGIARGFLKAGACPGQGDLPFVGKGFYRRAFDGFTPPKGGRTYLTLDGVQCRSVVKLNGRTVGGRPFGYASETIDVTDALRPTGNVLEIEAENVPRSSRWYPGSGIFRDVTVRVCPPDHVKPNTLFVRTLEATEKRARVAVSFEWRGGVSNAVLTVENPRLWSPEHPELHELNLFGETFRYGIRTAVFDPAKGFFLNGVHRQMRGVCLHHDLGPIGAAFDRDFARRQLALLKEMGCDAIRTSHNPPASALLDLCDEMGLLVMDEAFDMWELSKGDYSNFWQDWHARDLSAFVRRDRNHPSVVMWSIGNELREFDDADPARQIRIASELTAIVKANDPTRPVTFGSWKEAPMWNGCQNTVDAFGANYLPFKYAEFLRRNPKVGLVATETSSCVSSRGEYFFPVVASPIRGEGDLKRRRDEGRSRMVRGAQMSGYDLWGPHSNDYPPDVEFEHQERNPQVYGEFVWTGFDYLGEPDPCAASGGRSSYFGIFDLAGLAKDRYWLYKAQWRPDEPTAHILPHWTWPGREGEVTPVHVYSSGDEAELFVNGVSQGRKRRGRYEYRFRWDDVRYTPGELRVKTWRKGREWAEDVVRTAGAPVRLERAERRFGRLTFVTFTLKDANGTICPTADRELAFAVRPGTRLLSLCNGDAASREDFRGTSMRTFHGLIVAAVEGDPAGLSATIAADAESDVARFDARIAADTTLASADGMVWTDAAALPMESKVCAKTATPYGRIPSDLIDKVPRGIRDMSAHSTGHYFLFRTDSDKLGVRWQCRQVSWSDPYIPPQGMYGVDIYAKVGGRWRFVKNGRLGKNAWQETRADLPGSGLREVMVYLPIRADVLNVRLGIVEGKTLVPCGHESGHAKPVVHYGTSLVHGGCASRPGLAFTALAARQADVPYVNLGFSGQARLDLVMADVMARADAALYIVDPVWNCDEKLIEERAGPFVRRLHALRPDVPILLCEGPEAAGVRLRANEALNRAYEKLKADPALAGKIHYLPCAGMLPDDGEATHDYIHPNDYGSVQMGLVFGKAITAVLLKNEPKENSTCRK